MRRFGIYDGVRVFAALTRRPRNSARMDVRLRGNGLGVGQDEAGTDTHNDCQATTHSLLVSLNVAAAPKLVEHPLAVRQAGRG